MSITVQRPRSFVSNTAAKYCKKVQIKLIDFEIRKISPFKIGDYARIVNPLRIPGKPVRTMTASALLLFLALFSAPAMANGEAQYQQFCSSCHGATAAGNDALGSPALAAQDADYLVRQYNNFANGIRGTDAKDSFGQQMAAMSKVLADEAAVRAVADYLSALPVSKAVTAAGDAKNGFKYYQTCGSCHGANAQGNPALSAPSLLGLSEAYMKRQHDNFNAGLRGTHKDDRLGKQMKMMAGTMRDEKVLQDVLAYITSLGE